MKEQLLLILGSEGTAVELEEYITEADSSFDKVIRVRAFGDEDFKSYIISLQEQYAIRFIFGFTYNHYRDACLDLLHKLGVKAYSFIHPSAFVASSVNYGQGCYIGPNSTIAPHVSIGDHVMVNINASVGHHSVVGDHVSILPGARVSGGVSVGNRSLVGSNAVIFQGLTIGNDNLVDALTYVKKSLSDNQISFGAKSKSIKRI